MRRIFSLTSEQREEVNRRIADEAEQEQKQDRGERVTWSDSDGAFSDGKGKFWTIRQQSPPDNRWYIVEYEPKDGLMNSTSTDFGYFATGEEAMEAAERAAKRSANEA